MDKEKKSYSDLHKKIEVLSKQANDAALESTEYIKAELATLIAQLPELEQNLKSNYTKAKENFQTKYKEMSEKYAKLEADFRNNSYSALKVHVDNLMKQATEKSQAVNKTMKTELSKLKEQLPELEKKLKTNGEKAREEFGKMYKTLGEKYAKLEMEMRNISYSDLKAQIEDITKKAAQTAQTMTESMKQELDKLKTQMPELKQQLKADGVKSGENFEIKCKEISEACTKLENELKSKPFLDLKANLDKLMEHVDGKAQTGMDKIKDELANMRAQIPELEDKMNCQCPLAKEEYKKKFKVLSERYTKLEAELNKKP